MSMIINLMLLKESWYQKHDNDLFKPIENFDFGSNNLNCFLLRFRAIALEIYKKEYVISLLENMKHVREKETKVQQTDLELMIKENRQGLADLFNQKIKYHQENGLNMTI